MDHPQHGHDRIHAHLTRMIGLLICTRLKLRSESSNPSSQFQELFDDLHDWPWVAVSQLSSVTF